MRAGVLTGLGLRHGNGVDVEARREDAQPERVFAGREAALPLPVAETNQSEEPRQISEELEDSPRAKQPTGWLADNLIRRRRDSIIRRVVTYKGLAKMG